MCDNGVLVSDFDGTLAWLSLTGRTHQWLSRHRSGLILLIPFLPLIWVGYLLRPPIRSAKEVILRHKERGGRVVVFSSTEDLAATRFIIWSWLKAWQVPCDRLVLRPNEEVIEDFKAGVLMEEGCLVLLENEALIVAELIGRMLISGFRNISVTNRKRYYTVCFQKGGGVALIAGQDR